MKDYIVIIEKVLEKMERLSNWRFFLLWLPLFMFGLASVIRAVAEILK